MNPYLATYDYLESIIKNYFKNIPYGFALAYLYWPPAESNARRQRIKQSKSSQKWLIASIISPYSTVQEWNHGTEITGRNIKIDASQQARTINISY